MTCPDSHYFLRYTANPTGSRSAIPAKPTGIEDPNEDAGGRIGLFAARRRDQICKPYGEPRRPTGFPLPDQQRDARPDLRPLSLRDGDRPQLVPMGRRVGLRAKKNSTNGKSCPSTERTRCRRRRRSAPGTRTLGDRIKSHMHMFKDSPIGRVLTWRLRWPYKHLTGRLCPVKETPWTA